MIKARSLRTSRRSQTGAQLSSFVTLPLRTILLAGLLSSASALPAQVVSGTFYWTGDQTIQQTDATKALFASAPITVSGLYAKVSKVSVTIDGSAPACNPGGGAD